MPNSERDGIELRKKRKMQEKAEEPILFAYIGCGFAAQRTHIPNFAMLEDCAFLTLAEVRGGLGERAAARYGIPKVYRSHEEAADREIQAVRVSASFALQGRIAEDPLAAGNHVFMDKPVAVSLERAEAPESFLAWMQL
jgi:predicted dehydrogenase